VGIVGQEQLTEPQARPADALGVQLGQPVPEAGHRVASVRNSTAPHPTHLAIETPAMLLERSTSHPGRVQPCRCVVVVVVIALLPCGR
jgi:hypothetical protein